MRSFIGALPWPKLLQDQYNGECSNLSLTFFLHITTAQKTNSRLLSHLKSCSENSTRLEDKFSVLGIAFKTSFYAPSIGDPEQEDTEDPKPVFVIFIQ